MLEIGYLIVSAAITIVSLILLSVTIYSYRITGNSKLPLIIAVFLFFLIRGVFLSLGVFISVLTPFVTSYYLWIVDLVILTLLYVAALKR
jgi:hypothetical protein